MKWDYPTQLCKIILYNEMLKSFVFYLECRDSLFPEKPQCVSCILFIPLVIPRGKQACTNGATFDCLLCCYLRQHSIMELFDRACLLKAFEVTNMSVIRKINELLCMTDMLSKRVEMLGLIGFLAFTAL